ncbi:PAS domain-containing protein [Myxococcota bacterium]|nr:PAS domain-containing protein [Myxococcota bacterium]
MRSHENPEDAPALIRIVVFEAPEPANDTLPALDRIGAEVDFLRCDRSESCAQAASDDEGDLLVFDRRSPTEILEVLTGLGPSAPPSIAVLGRESAESEALEAFRAGVSDCVREGGDYAEVLPVVALEQIRRWRQQRKRAVANRKIAWLEGYSENIVQSINSALLVVDVDGRVTLANSTAGETLNADPLDMTGRSIDDWFPSDPAQPSLVRQTLEQGICFRGAETVIALPGRDAVPIGISCTPLLDSDGEPHGAVAIFQDLSEIKQLQQQVLQQEKMASIGQLAAGVAHEINNPMGFIHANLYQMTEYLDDLDAYLEVVDSLVETATEAAHPALAAVLGRLADTQKRLDFNFLRDDFRKAVLESQEGSERIRHIVRDLRDFSHKGNAERSMADVNQCVDTTANIVFTMMKHSVVLEKEYGEIPELSCYPMELKQVFMNLLVNAYQSIEEALAAGSQQALIRIVTREKADGIVVRVTDTGVGISKS